MELEEGYLLEDGCSFREIQILNFFTNNFSIHLGLISENKIKHLINNFMDLFTKL